MTEKHELVLSKIAEGWAPVPELLEATGWASHTLRGFLSASAKKMNIKIERRRENGVTSYRVVSDL